jgi:hypothetical protein
MLYGQEMGNFRVMLRETSDTSSSENKCCGRADNVSESDMSAMQEAPQLLDIVY